MQRITITGILAYKYFETSLMRKFKEKWEELRSKLRIQYGFTQTWKYFDASVETVYDWCIDNERYQELAAMYPSFVEQFNLEPLAYKLMLIEAHHELMTEAADPIQEIDDQDAAFNLGAAMLALEQNWTTVQPEAALFRSKHHVTRVKYHPSRGN